MQGGRRAAGGLAPAACAAAASPARSGAASSSPAFAGESSSVRRGRSRGGAEGKGGDGRRGARRAGRAGEVGCACAFHFPIVKVGCNWPLPHPLPPPPSASRPPSLHAHLPSPLDSVRWGGGRSRNLGYCVGGLFHLFITKLSRLPRPPRLPPSPLARPGFPPGAVTAHRAGSRARQPAGLLQRPGFVYESSRGQTGGARSRDPGSKGLQQRPRARAPGRLRGRLDRCGAAGGREAPEMLRGAAVQGRRQRVGRGPGGGPRRPCGRGWVSPGQSEVGERRHRLVVDNPSGQSSHI